MAGNIRLRLKVLWQATGGAILPLFSVLLIPILGATAAAVDYGVWLEKKMHLQGVADAAATAGAWNFRDSDDAAIAEAQNFINSNTRLPVDAQISVVEPGSVLQVRLVHFAQPIMSGILSSDGAVIAAAATAQAEFSGRPCMLALNPTADTGIKVQGSAVVRAFGCTLWSNAKGHKSFQSYNAATAHADGICAVGGVDARGDVQPNPKSGCNPRRDPLAGWKPPVPEGNCQIVDASGGNPTVTLKPGRYCGGLSFENGTVTLEPGIYFIEDGPFSLRGNVEVKGEGVGIFLTGDNAKLDFAGTGKLNVTAMDHGDMEGIVIAHDPKAPSGDQSHVGEESTIIGNFNLSFLGTIYLPNQTFNFWGNSDTAVDPPISYIIADKIFVGGNGKLRLRSNPGGTNVKAWSEPIQIVRLIK